MKSYGTIDFEPGTGIKEFVLEAVTEFPSISADRKGYLVWLTSGTSPGPYIFDGSSWIFLIGVDKEKWNVPFKFDPSTQILTSLASFNTGSTRLYINGLRQRLGSDYIESSPTTLTLMETVSQEQLNEGVSIILDYTYRQTS